VAEGVDDPRLGTFERISGIPDDLVEHGRVNLWPPEGDPRQRHRANQRLRVPDA
jgi:hypothetical protein